MVRRALQGRIGVCAVSIALIAVPVWSQGDTGALTPALRLGKRMFVEKQFTNPQSNFAASCRACHVPPWAPEGRRAYSDADRYSLIPTNSRARKRTTLRNVPTLLDVAGQARFNHDGRFASLEDAIAGELVSLHFGWLPEEREWALDNIHATLLYDAGVDEIAEGTYIEQLKRVYDVDVETMTREQAVGWVVKCLAEYVERLKSTQTSAFDAFAHMNRLPRGPAEGESPTDFGMSLLARIADLESRNAAKVHAGFSVEAYTGFKIFMRTSGEAGTGNCVTCHSPPLFTDRSFHNTGIAQVEYDAAHGSETFIQLAVPDAEVASRPVAKYGPRLEKGEQVNADLGYWNFVKPTEASAVASFKTPTLRNLEYTDPYMHNGAYATLKDAIAQKVGACTLAKSGALRNGDAAMSVMNITDDDIAPLAAFLTTLTDLTMETFEAHRRSGISLVDVEQE